jgi:adenylate cyclase class 2
MSLEIEVKILEIDVAQIIAGIEQMGARCEGEWLLKTSIYDFGDRRLLKQQSYVRIRSEGAHWHMTYKRAPKEHRKDAKVREEFDMEIGDPQVAEQILLGLGLQRTLYFEKKRQHYRHGDIVFDIDELPRLPIYLEIEAPSSEAIYATMASLGIPAHKAVTWGPRELLAHYGIKIDHIKELRF